MDARIKQMGKRLPNTFTVKCVNEIARYASEKTAQGRFHGGKREEAECPVSERRSGELLRCWRSSEGVRASMR